MVLLKRISAKKIGRKEPTEEYAQQKQCNPEILQDNEEIISDRMQTEGERQSVTKNNECKEHDTSLENKSMFETGETRNREKRINPEQLSQSENEDFIVFAKELEKLDTEDQEVQNCKNYDKNKTTKDWKHEEIQKARRMQTDEM